MLVFKKKRRHNYRRKNGHRQDLTVLRITEILTDGQKPSQDGRRPRRPRRLPQAKKAAKKTAAEGGAKPKAAAKKAAKPKAAKAKAKKE